MGKGKRNNRYIFQGLRNAAMGPRCREHWRRHNVKGRVYLMDLNNVQAGVQELKITSTSRFEADTFVPHGISVWEDKTAGKWKAEHGISVWEDKTAGKWNQRLRDMQEVG